MGECGLPFFCLSVCHMLCAYCKSVHPFYSYLLSPSGSPSLCKLGIDMNI